MDAAAGTPTKRIASRFIPLTRQAVIADLCHDPKNRNETDVFALVALRLQRHRNRGYRVLAEEMRRCYLPFSPDRDTVRALSFAPEEMAAMETRLSNLTAHLLNRANYQRLNTIEINEILNAVSPYSLRIQVDLEEYDELQVYVRDTYFETRSVRRPETLYLLKAHYEVRVFRRLFVLLKLKSEEDRAKEWAAQKEISERRALKEVRRRRKSLPPDSTSEHIYIKVFKDMVQHDLQILFPLRVVQFRPFDKMKFYATAGGGTLVGIFTTTGKVLAATNPITLLGAMAGFAGLLVRQVTKFFNQRTQYMMELAQKLFFHNLANNRAALALLLDRAEEEDVKEDLITLYFHAGETLDSRELAGRKRTIDEMIAKRYDAAVDFELDDALSRLEEDGVVTRSAGKVRFATLAEAAGIYAKLLESDDEDEARHICDPAPPVDAMEA